MLVAVIFLLAILGIQVQPENPDDLRREIANPMSQSQAIDFELRGNENYGPHNRTQAIFDIQPKFYSKFDSFHWVHYFDLPILAQPDAIENKSEVGLGNSIYRSYLSEGTNKDPWVWGIGPALGIPSAGSRLGLSHEWAGGFSFALIYQPSLFSVGAEATQLFGEDHSDIYVKPIVKIRIGQKTTVGFFDTLHIDWRAEEHQRVTFPMGAEYGQLFRGPRDSPVEVKLGAFSNIKRPDDTSDWYWRISVNVLSDR